VHFVRHSLFFCGTKEAEYLGGNVFYNENKANEGKEKMDQMNMRNLGFDDTLAMAAAADPALYPGRIASQSRDLFRVLTAQGELLAKPAGRFRESAAYPAVGDFVLLDRDNAAGGYGKIERLLPRRSAFVRKEAGTGSREQVVAANIDRVLICMALHQDFNVRRMERYLSIAWDSGAVPVIILTKADLCGDLAARLAEVKTAAVGVDVLVTSGWQGEGIDAVRRQLEAGRTLAFLGSSGVGKTTLINCLLGESRLATGAVRSDGKGRHTTTWRELFVLPDQGVLLDTPGMRELGLERANLGRTFADIESLATQCRFKDCQHTAEPDCAVRRAIAAGELEAARLESYQKLQRELLYAGLSARQRETEKLNAMFANVGGIKNVRRFAAAKKRR
jgi:ribosome biogenesis GTPase / thiamine phosphate phosphatase